MEEKKTFRGPLFVVGVSRSGTKLLRTLLNQHPKIGLPVVESKFIPYMVERFGDPPAFGTEEAFQQFYTELTQTKFFIRMKERGKVLKWEQFNQDVDKTSWFSIFKMIFLFYAPSEKERDFIWGDKTPGYLVNITLLKKLFPQAKFLHIIRDPRDCVSSQRKAWGQNIYRSAHYWRQSIEVARASGRKVGQDYMEIFYESLLDSPENLMRAICRFLECDFVSAMTELSSPSENLGDTKGQTVIVKSNMRKYEKELTLAEIKRIEEIVFPTAVSLGYKMNYGQQFRPLSAVYLQLFRVYDKLAKIKFDIAERGLSRGFRQALRN